MPKGSPNPLPQARTLRWPGQPAVERFARWTRDAVWWLYLEERVWRLSGTDQIEDRMELLPQHLFSALNLLESLAMPHSILLILLAGQAETASHVQDVGHERVAGLCAVRLRGMEDCSYLLILPCLKQFTSEATVYRPASGLR